MIRRMIIPTAVLLILTLLGCSKLKESTPTGTPAVSEYVGSSACAVCHASISAEYVNTGHHSALKAVVRGVAPSYPASVTALTSPPTGYSWSDIIYVIGGFAWKANFVNTNGSMVTGTGTQWNYQDQAWADYRTDAGPGEVEFDCGGCHTTGYDNTAGGHQGNIGGIVGTWYENGVGCESCHGPGRSHADNPREVRMTINDNSSLCGNCHYRDAGFAILADSLILHNQQYAELRSAGHSNLRCVTCHDPHKSTVYDASALSADCSQCHDMTVNHQGPDECILCHMPYSVRSATMTGSGIHLSGDMRSHIFKINTDTQQDQFYTINTITYSEGFNGLNFTCLSQCHSSRSLGWAEANAGSIHP